MRIRKTELVGLGAFVVAVAAALTVVVATGGADEPTQPSTTPVSGPSLAPLKLSADPLWRIEDAQADVDMRDGVVLTLERKSGHLTLTELATGKARWSLEGGHLPGGGLPDTWQVGPPLLVGRGDSLAVLVAYQEFSLGSDSHERGLTLLSGKDGSVLWKTPTLSTDGGLYQVLWAADDHTAMVNVFPSTKITDVHRQVRAIAYDLATGTKRWEQPGLWPYAIAGDTVLGEESAHSIVHRGGYGSQPLAKVVAVDVATGEKRWDLGERFAGSNLMGVGGDVVVVRGVANRPNTGKQYLALAAATGRELIQFDNRARLDSCGSDGLLVIACEFVTSKTNSLTTIRIDDRKTTTTERDVPGIDNIDAVWQGRIFGNGYDGTPRALFVSVDQAGHLIDDELPGRILGLSDQLAVFWIDTGDPAGGLAVYQVTA